MDDLTKTIATTVSSAIEAQAKAQFLAALGGTDELIDRFLKVAANYTVERNYKKIPLLDAVIQDAVQKVVIDLVNEMLQDERGRVKVELAKRLRSDAKTVAEQLVNNVFPAGKGLYLDIRVRSD